MKQEGLLYIVSAPSGAGKTSLCNELIDIFPNLRHSVSYTTRIPRPGEADGVDYFFVSREEFERMSAAGEFAEWAEVHGNLYGTAVRTLEEYRSQGIHVILDIDCQGARQLKSSYRDAVYIFILPPSFEELRKRLEGRNTDSPDVIERRMRVGTEEVKESSWYDYLVVNDDFPRALEQLKSIIIAEQCRTDRVVKTVSGTFTII
ncbi:MAG: guanylate kinase [Deltaproteobacteria bacterium]|nr:guanylate kinase [Deltaproteobacteria bacterium]